MDPKALRELLPDLDGWSILDASKLVSAGVPETMVAELTDTFESNPQRHKQTLFVDGKPVNQVRGVYALQLLWKLAESVNADTTEAGKKFGRGFQANELKAAILTALDAEPAIA